MRATCYEPGWDAFVASSGLERRKDAIEDSRAQIAFTAIVLA